MRHNPLYKYWTAAKIAWSTYRWAVAHQRAHEYWEQVYNAAADDNMEKLLEISRDPYAKR